MVDIPALSVISGKGGVGKTLVSSSIVLALAARGKRVGVVDADYSNPNLHRFLGMTGDVDFTSDRRMIPVRRGNISLFTIESIAGDRGVGMRGEDYANITRDVLEFTDWDSDILVVDLPAAVGDEWRTVLSVMDNYYLGSILVVQPSHVETAERVIRLHMVNGVPIIGMVENMVSFTCPRSGETYEIFGRSTADELSQKYGIPVLAKIPIMLEVQEMMRAGGPVALPEDTMRPVVDAILAAQPRKLGFLEEMKRRVKEYSLKAITEVLVSSLRIMNSSLNIRMMREQYNMAEGATAAIMLLDDDGEPLRGAGGAPLVYNFRVMSDKIVLVESPKEVDALLMIKVRALAAAMLGEKKLPDGTRVPYTILDAFLNNDARLSGAGSFVRGLRFYKYLFESARVEISKRIRPLLEAFL